MDEEFRHPHLGGMIPSQILDCILNHTEEPIFSNCKEGTWTGISTLIASFHREPGRPQTLSGERYSAGISSSLLFCICSENSRMDHMKTQAFTCTLRDLALWGGGGVATDLYVSLEKERGKHVPCKDVSCLWLNPNTFA